MSLSLQPSLAKVSFSEKAPSPQKQPRKVQAAAQGPTPGLVNKPYLDFVGQFEKYFLNSALDTESMYVIVFLTV